MIKSIFLFPVSRLVRNLEYRKYKIGNCVNQKECNCKSGDQNMISPIFKADCKVDFLVFIPFRLLLVNFSQIDRYNGKHLPQNPCYIVWLAYLITTQESEALTLSSAPFCATQSISLHARHLGNGSSL